MSPVRAKGAQHPPGLTLIELLFAIAIMSFALLGVAGMFLAAFRSVAAGGQETKATALTRAMSDMIQSDSFNDLVSRYNGKNTNSLSVTCPVTTGSGVDPDHNLKKWKCDILGGGVQDSGRGLPGGYGTIVVLCVNADGTSGACSSTDLRQVTVTVTWERQGPRSVSVVTYVSRS